MVKFAEEQKQKAPVPVDAPAMETSRPRQLSLPVRVRLMIIPGRELLVDKVELIACTLVDWPTFVDTCVKMYGSSPTRELDKRNITVGTPATYVMALESLNNRTINLKEAGISLDFVHVTFAVHFEDIDAALKFNNLLTGPRNLFKI